MPENKVIEKVYECAAKYPYADCKVDLAEKEAGKRDKSKYNFSIDPGSCDKDLGGYKNKERPCAGTCVLHLIPKN